MVRGPVGFYLFSLKVKTVFFPVQDTPKINKLRDYYERALQEFGTSDDGEKSEYLNVLLAQMNGKDYVDFL